MVRIFVIAQLAGKDKDKVKANESRPLKANDKFVLRKFGFGCVEAACGACPKQWLTSTSRQIDAATLSMRANLICRLLHETVA